MYAVYGALISSSSTDFLERSFFTEFMEVEKQLYQQIPKDTTIVIVVYKTCAECVDVLLK